jgi:hypothetical protein
MHHTCTINTVANAIKTTSNNSTEGGACSGQRMTLRRGIGSKALVSASIVDAKLCLENCLEAVAQIFRAFETDT